MITWGFHAYQSPDSLGLESVYQRGWRTEPYRGGESGEWDQSDRQQSYLADPRGVDRRMVADTYDGPV